MDSDAEQAKIAQAKQELKINVPIYRIEQLENGGLRFYLYGHRFPVDWTPSPPPTKTRRRKAAT